MGVFLWPQTPQNGRTAALTALCPVLRRSGGLSFPSLPFPCLPSLTLSTFLSHSAFHCSVISFTRVIVCNCVCVYVIAVTVCVCVCTAPSLRSITMAVSGPAVLPLHTTYPSHPHSSLLCVCVSFG